MTHKYVLRHVKDMRLLIIDQLSNGRKFEKGKFTQDSCHKMAQSNTGVQKKAPKLVPVTVLLASELDNLAPGWLSLIREVQC